MVEIRNSKQLHSALNQIGENVIEHISNDIIKSLQKRIMEDVYSSHSPNSVYYNNTKKPTMEFYNSWKWDKLKKDIDGVIKTLFYDPSDMRFDSETFLHGSKYSKPNDVRETLMDILNKDGFSSRLWISVQHKAYWDNFITEMFDSGAIDNFIKRYLR